MRTRRLHKSVFEILNAWARKDGDTMRGTKKLMELLLCLALSSLYVGSGAVADSVDYLDDERHIAAKDCLILTDQTDWGMSDETHWYAVQGSVTIGDRITVSGKNWPSAKKIRATVIIQVSVTP